MKTPRKRTVRRPVKLQHSKTPELGDLAIDRITGFTGVIVCVDSWLNGCMRLTLQPQGLDKNGATRAAGTFDHEQVAVVKKHVICPMQPSGGPMPSPQTRPAPTR